MKKRLFWIITWIACLSAGLLGNAASVPARPDILLMDFEGADYRGWQVEGEAFGPAPAQGTLSGQMKVEGFRGNGLANSYYGGDGSTGQLTSPSFVINRRYLKFLIGGGGYAEETFIELQVDGKRVRTATGPNTQPGGSEALDWQVWDLADLQGKSSAIRIVDRRTAGWGHINIDHLVLSDRPPPALVQSEREFTIKRHYLNLPIKHGGPKRLVSLMVDGKVAVRNEIELADATPDWWAPMDVRSWHGKTIKLRVDRLPEDSAGLGAIEQSDSLKDAGDLYREPLRAQFHFSPRRGWNNDPNGLCYYKGEYHLFFQHNPYGWNWGNMHWGHAVSRDLVHWRELGDVLMPDQFGPMFSGSAVVDWNNTSGLGKPGRTPLSLLYTAAGDPTVQCLATSVDGRVFEKFPANPVLGQVTSGNRDPKVIWHAPSKHWVMVLYVGKDRKHTVHFYTSPNLREWSLASVLEGGEGDDHFLFECPDLFELPVDGHSNVSKWVVYGANSEYAIGQFDGKVFTPEETKIPGHRGKGFYAAQTFSDIPARDGRRIQIGWFQTPTSGMPFNQSMSLPLELRLITCDQKPRLTWTPVKELQSLRSKSFKLGSIELKPGSVNPLSKIKAELVELRAEFEDSADVTFTIRGARISYRSKTHEIVVNGHKAPAPSLGGRQDLIVYCDRTGLEVFVSGGLTYVPMPFIPRAEDQELKVEVEGPVRFTGLRVHQLRSAWK